MTQTISLKSLTTPPGAGYEAPFEMLAACHERVHRMLALLTRLRAHVQQHGADTQAQQAARDVMRYFDQAAPHHHQDEERHVFPPLLAQGDAALVALVGQLQADHRQMEARWPAARAVLAAVADGQLQQLAPAHQEALDAFAVLYAAHIVAEEQTAYPVATRLLGTEALTAMSAEMMRRRGVV